MKKLLIVLAAFAVLVLAGYFVVTSSAFIKAVVLPRVGATLDARVEAESIALRPFSSVEIRRLVVTPNGAETLATADLARVRYRLGDLLGGTIALDEVRLVSPSITVIQKADGTSNLDPILKKLSAGPAQPTPPPSEPGQPLRIDLRTVAVEKASLAYRADAGDGSRLSAEVKNLDFTASQLANGSRGQLQVGADWSLEQSRPATASTPASTDSARGTLRGKHDLDLGPDLVPAGLKGLLEAQGTTATGALQQFQGLAVALDLDLATAELRRASLAFSKQGTPLGSVSAQGPLDLSRMEAKLQVTVSAIDRNVLNLVGQPMGLDFVETRFDATNAVELASGGRRIAVAGSVLGRRVSVKQGDLVLPPLDLRKSYDLTVDLAAQTARLQSFSLTANQGGRDILRGTLSQPLQVGWATSTPALPDAALEWLVSDLRLADWSALAGTPLAGSIDGKMRVGVQAGGKDLGLDASLSLRDLSGTFASNQVKNLGGTAQAKATVAAFADPSKRRLRIEASVKDLTGAAAVVAFDRFGIETTADIGLPEGAVDITGTDVKLAAAGRPGGTLNLKGRWNTLKPGGDLQLTARGLNEDGLRPFLQAALGDKQLRSVRLEADLGLRVDPAAETSVKATASLTNLVVRDPSGTVPESPLAAGLTLDAAGSTDKVVLRQAELRLAPTARAANVASLQGNLDFSRTNALRGQIAFASESLDITPYFDLFAGGSASATNAPAPATPPPAPTGPQTEPDAIQLPVELLTVDAKIGKFFLRDIAAENFVAAIKIQGSRIEVQPFQLSLNGAPIKAGTKLNLGVPGFEYDVQFSAAQVPVRPFANSFVPMLKDRIEGTINAGAEIKGAGTTGLNLQKHLAGGLQFSVTNANLKLVDAGRQKPGILSALVGLLATALNIREIKDQPIMDIEADAKLGGGKIDLARFAARSQSIAVASQGSIPIAADLMQSPVQLPVQVSLGRPLAEKARLVASDTPTNATYVALPAIASIKGTLGAPSPEIDKLKTAALAARGIAGLVGGQAGDTLGAAADLLGGSSAGNTNAVGNLIQGLGGLFGGKATGGSTTNAATNAPSGILRNLFPPKKQ